MLTDMLDELAREAPTGGAPPDQLWRHGRRLARTRRIGTVAIAAVACLLLIALGSVTWQQRAVDPPVVDTETKTYVPARIHPPSPYLPGTDELGPPGVLIATIQAARKGWADRGLGLVGVSATTGAYLFLDLPDAHPEHVGDTALSPDGRHVAYWITGSVPDPLPERPEVPSSSAFSEYPPIVGFAVYDTVTGKVERQVRPTQHGIGGQAFVWFDPEHLGVAYGQMRDCCSSTAPRAMVFDLNTDQAADLSAGLDSASTTGVGSVIDVSGDAVIIETDGTTTPAKVPATAGKTGGSQYVAMTPDSKRAAVIVGVGVPGRISVTGIHEDGSDRLLPGTFSGVIAWLDDTHLAALDPRGDGPTLDLVSVDVRDGSTEVLSRSVDDADVALNLLSSPVADQPAPPRPRSPWVPTVAAALTVTVAAWAALAWRRRAGD